MGVLVLEHDPAVARLMEHILDDEGYQARSMLLSRGPTPVLEDIRSRRPDLVIVDIAPTNPSEGYDLLDTLRSDPEAQQVPVLATGTHEAMTEASLASFNVREVVEKPFALDDFLEKVQRAAGLPALFGRAPTREGPHLPILDQAKEVLDRYSREALLHWVELLRREEPWRDRPDLHLAAVLDHTPVLMEAVSAALVHGDSERFFREHPDAEARVLEHARIRCSQRLSLDSLIREYTLLRDEIWASLSRHLPGPIQASDLYPLQQAVSGTLDAILERTIPEYLKCSKPL